MSFLETLLFHPEQLSELDRDALVLPVWSYLFMVTLCLLYASHRLSGMHVTKRVVGFVIGFLLIQGIGATFEFISTSNMYDVGPAGLLFGFLSGWLIARGWLKRSDARANRLGSPKS